MLTSFYSAHAPDVLREDTGKVATIATMFAGREDYCLQMLEQKYVLGGRQHTESGVIAGDQAGESPPSTGAAAEVRRPQSPHQFVKAVPAKLGVASEEYG